MTEQQLWAIANPIMDNLMDASTQRNHARHVRDFTDRLKGIVTPGYLECVCQQYQKRKRLLRHPHPHRHPPPPRLGGDLMETTLHESTRRVCRGNGAGASGWPIFSGSCDGVLRGLTEDDTYSLLILDLMKFVMIKAEWISPQERKDIPWGLQ